MVIYTDYGIHIRTVSLQLSSNQIPVTYEFDFKDLTVMLYEQKCP